MCNITLDEYRKAVEYYASNGIDNLIHNRGNEHALIIFQNIFRTANGHIRIAANNLWNDEVVNTKEYIDSLSAFLNRPNSKLDILLTDEPHIEDVKAKEGYNIYRMLYNHRAYLSGRVRIMSGEGRTFQHKGTPLHFCTADGHMYRLETNPYEREAQCNFCDTTHTGKLIDNFDRVYSSELKVVDLNEYFA